MAVMQMQRISICALKQDRRAILEHVQSLGAIEVSSVIDEDDEAFEKEDTRELRQEFDRKANLTEQALGILDKYSPEEKKEKRSSLDGPVVISRSELEDVRSRSDATLRNAEEITSWGKQISDNKAEIVKLRNQIEALSPWMALDVPLSFTGTERTSVMIGTMPPETTQESIGEALAQEAPDACGVEITEVSRGSDALYMTAICLKEDRKAVEDALRSIGFSAISLSGSLTPEESVRQINDEIAKLKAENEELSEKIRGAHDERSGLKAAGDDCRMQSKECEVVGGMPESRRVFILSGYTPSAYAERVKKSLTDRFDCVVDVDEVPDDEEAPVVLKNSKFSESVEGVLSSYGLPHKGEIDPTTIMSYFYVFFFGLMLSDAIYGAIMAIGCFVAIKKHPGMEYGLRKTLRMFGLCGISTAFWGVMFGGYCGDAPTVIAETFFHKEFTIPPLWFEPLTNPMKLLMWCLLFGLIHLYTGLGIKGYEELKDHKYMDFFCDVVLWYAFLIGLVLLLLPTDIFESISQLEFKFSAGFRQFTKWLTIAGAVGIILTGGRDHRNVALRIALGAYDLYGVTSWLSDVLSYSRLLALGLATGVIASVINMMASMVATNVFGKIMFFVIFLLGHVLNMAINLLGAYVHTNRLQYVEFFGKFYEAGGRPFKPLTTDSKYIKIKEEY